MPTPYTDVENFPFAINEIDDSVDPPVAATFNTFPEGLANRTRFLYNGLYPNSVALSVPSDLTALSNPPNLYARTIEGYGTYVYHSASTTNADGTYIVNGNGGTGRWLHTLNSQQFYRYIQSETVQLGSHFDLLAAATGVDPAGRGSSTGHKILTTASFTFRAGDLLKISYMLPTLIQNSSLVVSSFASGVRFQDGAGYQAFIGKTLYEPTTESSIYGMPSTAAGAVYHPSSTSVYFDSHYGAGVQHTAVLELHVGYLTAVDVESVFAILKSAVLTYEQIRLSE